MGLNRKQRKAVTRETVQRYRRASRREKSRILEQYTKLNVKKQSLSYKFLNRDVESLGKFNCNLLANRPYPILHV